MKISFLSPFAHKNKPSGARTRLEGLVSILAKDNEVTVYSPSDVACCGVTNVYATLDGNALRRVVNLITTWTMICRKARGLVISESPISFSMPYLFRTVLVIHDTKFVGEYGRSARWATYGSYWISSRLCSAVQTVSASEREKLSKVLGISKNKITVSYNGLSQDWFEPCGNSPTDFDFLYVANFAPHKGHLALLDVLKDFFPSHKLCLVGTDYGTLSQVEDFIANYSMKCEIFEDLSIHKLISVYDSSRVFVFPSHLEGFGLPFIEARSRNLPVVANKLEVFDELAARVGGYIVDIEDRERFATQLKRASKEQQENAQADVHTLFSWEQIAARLLKDVNYQL